MQYVNSALAHRQQLSQGTPATGALDQPQRARQIAVLGSCGGLGTTTLAAQLACSNATEVRTWLIESAPAGTLESTLGLEDHQGLRWQHLAGTRGDVDVDALAQATPHYGGARVLMMDRFAQQPPEPETITAVMSSLKTAGLPVVVDSEPSHIVGKHNQFDLIVVVTPLSLIGLNAVISLRAKLEESASRIVLVGSALRPMTLSAEQFSQAAELPVIGWLPKDRRLSAQIEGGTGPLGLTPRRQTRALLHTIRTQIPARTLP